MAKLEATREQNQETTIEVEPAKEDISYDQFMQVDLRVCKILKAEKVAKTKKLLKLWMDTGVDQREVISGIAEFYEPETLIGKEVLMLINLQPKEIKGVSSHGMLLLAENSKGELVLLTPEKET
ncbi:MAG TPA: methionine--tRNA ligase subunit beta, partial [Bacteroidales bacterium]|nr:methionine--tRNA ligase subunit beta [Bacteroidales bacterium]